MRRTQEMRLAAMALGHDECGPTLPITRGDPDTVVAGQPNAVTAADRIIAARYRLSTLLGAGGMGAVWLAEDAVLGRVVALKQLTPPATGGPVVHVARGAGRCPHLAPRRRPGVRPPPRGGRGLARDGGAPRRSASGGHRGTRALAGRGGHADGVATAVLAASHSRCTSGPPRHQTQQCSDLRGRPGGAAYAPAPWRGALRTWPPRRSSTGSSGLRRTCTRSA
jgi:hypothetical protein